jgi:predicted GIY-YIG superfamily endonuclease
MPRKAMDYSKTIIYKIQHEDNEELVYVGHTTDFIKRKSGHKTKCNNENDKAFNIKLYTMIRANGGWQCFKMVMIEEYPCANHLEACRREDECMRQLKATMNSCGAVLDKEKQFGTKEAIL